MISSVMKSATVPFFRVDQSMMLLMNEYQLGAIPRQTLEESQASCKASLGVNDHENFKKKADTIFSRKLRDEPVMLVRLPEPG